MHLIQKILSSFYSSVAQIFKSEIKIEHFFFNQQIQTIYKMLWSPVEIETSANVVIPYDLLIMLLFSVNFLKVKALLRY